MYSRLRSLRIDILLVLTTSSIFACAPSRGNASALVSLKQNSEAVTLANGLVTAELGVAKGELNQMWLGKRGVFAEPSYLDWETTKGNHLSRPVMTIRANPSENNGQKAEVVFSQIGRGDLDVELHYVMLPGERALRMFAVFTHPADRKAIAIGQSRFVSRVDDKYFETIAVDADRFRELPPPKTQYNSLGPKESRQFTSGPWKGYITDKYHYFADVGDHFVHGWTGRDSKLGCWIVYGSTEDQNGGPTRQHNTAHWERILLKILFCSHYGSPATSIPAGQKWQKVYGPWMIYLNEDAEPAALRADAERQAASERAAWPAAWLDNPAFAKPDTRGAVSGKLVIRDPQAPNASVANAWVGLAEPKPDWQQQALNYQYWTHADAQGHFTIPAARSGDYTFYAFVDGVLGEFRRDNVTVKAGATNNLGEITWTPLRHGRQLWEIGNPDRTAGEFRHGDNYRQWGLWLKYPAEFPNGVTFTIGKSDTRQDWNFAQVPVKQPDGSFVAEPWRILFECDAATAKLESESVLRVAIAGANSGLRVVINGREAAELRKLPQDHALSRAGIHGQYSQYTVRFPTKWLQTGQNEMQLELVGSPAVTKFIMYDYLRLEVPGI